MKIGHNWLQLSMEKVKSIPTYADLLGSSKRQRSKVADEGKVKLKVKGIKSRPHTPPLPLTPEAATGIPAYIRISPDKVKSITGVKVQNHHD